MGLAFADCRIAENRVFDEVLYSVIRQIYRGKQLWNLINWIMTISNQ